MFGFFETTIGKILIAPLGYIIGKVIEIIIYRFNTNWQGFRTAYSKFAEAFTSFLQQLDIGDDTLNALILIEFPKHDLARRDFIRHLKGSRKRKFNQKWLQYEEKYYQIKQFGAMGIVMSFAPNVEAMRKARSSPQDKIKWEADRRKELYNIISDLLKIAERK